MIELQNARFAMNFVGGYQADYWGLYGQVFGHPSVPDGDYVFVSAPVEYDRQTKVMKGFSGKLYQLFDPNEETEREIEETIKRGGYSRH